MRNFVAPRWLEKGGNICQSTRTMPTIDRSTLHTSAYWSNLLTRSSSPPLLVTDRTDKIKQVTQTNKAQTTHPIGLHIHTSSSTFSIDKTTRPSVRRKLGRRERAVDVCDLISLCIFSCECQWSSEAQYFKSVTKSVGFWSSKCYFLK